ncbi:hypothetical protein ACIBO2_29135 [Nonomuraea sp. NPDC050022]|uniref:hypothetical protein n=1 Tax=Nonomuraea sp. NPDC050022 TaxID=3364358 RepID=UPI0037A70BD0
MATRSFRWPWTSRTRPAATEAVKQAHEHFGRLDAVVNNAGFGLFGTGFATSSAWSQPLAAYDGVREAVNAGFATMPSPDPAGVGTALLKVVDADNPPPRVFFGSLPHHVVPQVYAERLKTWQEWAELSAEAETSQG